MKEFTYKLTTQSQKRDPMLMGNPMEYKKQAINRCWDSIIATYFYMAGKEGIEYGEAGQIFARNTGKIFDEAVSNIKIEETLTREGYTAEIGLEIRVKLE